MTNFQFFLGSPVEFKNLCLIYPPKIKEVVNIKQYDVYAHLLTISQEEIEDEMIERSIKFEPLTPFEYILNDAYNSEEFKNMLQKAFYFFIHEEVSLLFEQKQILIGDLQGVKSIHELRFLTEADFFEFQNIIREACGLRMIEPPKDNEDPRIKAMKAKARYRDKVKAKSGKGLKLQTLVTSICFMGLGLNPLNIGELSYAAIPLLLNWYQNKEKYDIDIDSLLAGADSKKVKPKYWIQNLDEQ
jgi:hypothetical protein